MGKMTKELPAWPKWQRICQHWQNDRGIGGIGKTTVSSSALLHASPLACTAPTRTAQICTGPKAAEQAHQHFTCVGATTTCKTSRKEGHVSVNTLSRGCQDHKNQTRQNDAFVLPHGIDSRLEHCSLPAIRSPHVRRQYVLNFTAPTFRCLT
jgi:hypothetical protein